MGKCRVPGEVDFLVRIFCEEFKKRASVEEKKISRGL
jgi:hypothetical protein